MSELVGKESVQTAKTWHGKLIIKLRKPLVIVTIVMVTIWLITIIVIATEIPYLWKEVKALRDQSSKKHEEIRLNRKTLESITEDLDQRLKDLEAEYASMILLLESTSGQVSILSTTQRHDRNELHMKILDIQESIDSYNSFWRSLVYKVTRNSNGTQLIQDSTTLVPDLTSGDFSGDGVYTDGFLEDSSGDISGSGEGEGPGMTSIIATSDEEDHVSRKRENQTDNLIMGAGLNLTEFDSLFGIPEYVVNLLSCRVGAPGEKGEVGIQGPQGLKGIMGQKGDKGRTGDRGIIGEKGIKGEKGFTGLKGERGDIGPQGVRGMKGYHGAQGQKGETGDPGRQGTKGEVGHIGATGDKGSKGEQGLVGPKGDEGVIGAKGDKGDIGMRGEVGLPGLRGEYGAKGEQGVIGNPGAAGEKGEKGNPGIQGPYGPPGRDGKNGANAVIPEIFTANQLQNMLNATAMATITAIQKAGLKGEPGVHGIDGTPGRNGRDGTDGKPGVNGINGEPGSNGRDGKNGKDGTPGQKGAAGQDNTLAAAKMKTFVLQLHRSVTINNKVYSYIPRELNWNDAQKLCKSQGGRLPVFESSIQLQNFFSAYHQTINQRVELWVGAKKQWERFYWYDQRGNSLSYISTYSDLWLRGEPNNAGGNENCVDIYYASWGHGLNDDACNSEHNFLCEYDNPF